MLDSAKFSTETDRFKLEDLFFSRTDKRGVILSANRAFGHVAAMEWDDLIGAPHKVIRNPDMPKTIYGLMWETIQKDDPIATYVINLANDGQYYWAFSLVIPINDGYLSICLKPTSPRLREAKALYEKLRAAEETPDFTIEGGKELLSSLLSELGFRSYTEFMIYSLRDEVSARNMALNRLPDRLITCFEQINRSIARITKKVQVLRCLFEKSAQIPFNMRLQASRIESANGPLSVVSNNYKIVAQDLSEKLDSFSKAAALGAEPILWAGFISGATNLMHEVGTTFEPEDERLADLERQDQDRKVLESVKEMSRDQSNERVKELVVRVRHLAGICRGFRRAMPGLEMTRLMCQIERSKINGEVPGLDEITEQLLQTERSMMKVIMDIETEITLLFQASEDLESAQQID